MVFMLGTRVKRNSFGLSPYKLGLPGSLVVNKGRLHASLKAIAKMSV